MVLSGQLRPIAMYTKERYARLPDVPTTLELGYGYYNDTLFSVFGPAGMKPEVVKQIEDAVEKSLEMAPWKKFAETFGMVTVKMRSAEYTKFLEEAWKRELDVQKSLGLITDAATEPR